MLYLKYLKNMNLKTINFKTNYIYILSPFFSFNNDLIMDILYSSGYIHSSDINVCFKRFHRMLLAFPKNEFFHCSIEKTNISVSLDI